MSGSRDQTDQSPPAGYSDQPTGGDERKVFGVSQTLWLSDCSLNTRHRDTNSHRVDHHANQQQPRGRDVRSASVGNIDNTTTSSSYFSRQSADNRRHRPTSTSSGSGGRSGIKPGAWSAATAPYADNMQLVPIAVGRHFQQPSTGSRRRNDLAQLQCGVRDVATSLTQIVSEIRVASLDRRHSPGGAAAGGLARDCDVISDAVLPGLVEAAIRSVTRPDSLAAQTALVRSAHDAVEPGAELVLDLRKTLDVVDDTELVARLTSLALGTAEALRRMRSAAQRADATLTSRYDVIADDADWLARDRRWDDDVTGQEVAVYSPHVGVVACCDSAYRQIQQCGNCRGHWRSLRTDQLTQILQNIVNNCYALGKHMATISASAKQGATVNFAESIQCFADSICQIINSIPPVSKGQDSLLIIAGGIRHCASNLLTSARCMAADPHYVGSYRDYAAHSRALSRALTHLIFMLSTNYLDTSGDVRTTAR